MDELKPGGVVEVVLPEGVMPIYTGDVLEVGGTIRRDVDLKATFRKFTVKQRRIIQKMLLGIRSVPRLRRAAARPRDRRERRSTSRRAPPGRLGEDDSHHDDVAAPPREAPA